MLVGIADDSQLMTAFIFFTSCKLRGLTDFSNSNDKRPSIHEEIRIIRKIMEKQNTKDTYVFKSI